jgi:cell division protein FtsB
MAVLREIRAKARQILPPVLAVCVMGYFAYHSIQGERGYLALLRVEQDLAQARATEASLRAERTRLERDVNLLRLDGLDTDLLGERARVLLNYGLEDEYTILRETPRGR